MFWPRLILWALLFASLTLAVRGRWDSPETEPARNVGQSHERAGGFPIASIVCCAAYFAAFASLGFLVSTFLFCAAFAIVLGYRDWKRLAAFSLGVTVIMWLLVIKLMNVSLPRGIGVFRDVSLLFY